MPIAIANLVISTYHAPSLSLRDLHDQLIKYVMKPVFPDCLLSNQAMDRERDRLGSTVVFVDPPGALLVGGPKADAGLMGRKIIGATYGGMERHGGGAFSGKDPSKIGRSTASMVRRGLRDAAQLRTGSLTPVPEPMSTPFATMEVMRNALRDCRSVH